MWLLYFLFFPFFWNNRKEIFFPASVLSNGWLFLALSFKNSCWGITCSIANFIYPVKIWQLRGLKHCLTKLLADFKNACFSLHVGRTGSPLSFLITDVLFKGNDFTSDFAKFQSFGPKSSMLNECPLFTYSLNND